jgi:hypothetical protein
MKLNLIFLIAVITFTNNVSFCQKENKDKVLIIGQFDRPDERYAIEVTLTEIFAQNGLEAIPSLNILKQGSDPSELASDSLQNLHIEQGITTYLVVNVRGYDRRFKASTIDVSLSEILGRTSIYHIYREEATSVSLEFTFFREKQVYFRDILKCGNIAGRDSVLKRIRKKLPKRMSKKWVKG